MSDTLQYVLSLNDQISSKLQKIGVTSDNALNKFSKLQKQTKETSQLMKDMGGSVGALKAKLDLLKSEKEWIPSSNLQSIKRYNTEIQKLEKEIQKLDTIQGSTFKKNMKDAISNIPFAGLLTNPIALTGAAMAGTAKMALSFDEGMAKINTTAQLGQADLAKLKNELIDLGTTTGSDLSTIPESFEKIISQTGDVKLSTDILKQSLKGAKAGFTDQAVVADALAQTLSLVGAENTNAKEVLDTFFAAKRVGAGEFKDFANYMPGLIASGKALGVNFKETAGVFAYMTGKGQSAERAAVLMENAYSAMGKVDVRKNLSKAGIQIFDKTGTIRSMNDIFGDLKSKMNGMNDEQKSSFLAKMGLVDKEARSAFIIMTQDSKKLADSLKDVKNSNGETDMAFQKSKNNMQKIREIWSKVQGIAIKLGGALVTVLAPAFDALTWVIDKTINVFTWFADGLSAGSPGVWALTIGIGALTVALNWSNIVMKAQNMWLNLMIIKERILAVVTKAQAIATEVVTAAQWLWNEAMLANPIGLVIAGIAALAAGVYLLTKAWDGSSASAKLNQEIQSKVIEKTADQRVEVEKLFGQLKRAKVGSDEYKDTLVEIDKLQPGLTEKYNLQAGALNDINKAELELIGNIKKRAEVEVLSEMYTAAVKKRMKFDEFKKKNKGKNNGLLDLPGLDDQSLTKQSKFLYGQEAELLNKLTAAEKKGGIAVVDGPPGTVTDFTGTGGGTVGSDLGSKTNEAIATGGTKHTIINIQFKNMVETVKVSGSEFKENANQMTEHIGDALLRVLAMAATSA